MRLDAADWGLTIPRRIAFINEKGGSGKTTLVANVAAHLALRRGRRTLAIDMDPQGQLGKVLGLEVRRPRHSAIELLVDSVLGETADEATGRGDQPAVSRLLPATATRIPNLDVIVANKSLALFPSWTGGLASDDESTNRLAESLDNAPNTKDYDFILFDAPPSFGPLTLNILRAVDEVVIPVPLTFLALDGCAEMIRTLEMVRSQYDRPELRLVMVIPTFYRRTRLAHEILNKLQQRFSKELSLATVGYNVKIDEAQSRGLSIIEYAPKDRGAEVMASIAEELEARQIPTA
jgi:chromosome partitioning protein